MLYGDPKIRRCPRCRRGQDISAFDYDDMHSPSWFNAQCIRCKRSPVGNRPLDMTEQDIDDRWVSNENS